MLSPFSVSLKRMPCCAVPCRALPPLGNRTGWCTRRAAGPTKGLRNAIERDKKNSIRGMNMMRAANAHMTHAMQQMERKNDVRRRACAD
jgi:hypothetical protein